MGFVILIFLAIFWIGVILLILSGMGVISASLWAIAIVWLVILGLFSTFIALSMRRIDRYIDEREALDSIERAGAEKVKQMRKEQAFMYDDFGL
ncbi:hypothetical protein J6W91_03485 [Candidatus Saccharibacteria bacterium]|nr:hypothetical protein [Candidatus Saccharibacteria bacterium]